MEYIKSESLKIKRTSIRKIAVLAPVFLGLFSFYVQGFFFATNNYNFWYGMIFPVIASLIAGMVMQKDSAMRERAVLSLPVDLKRVWFSKVMVAFGVIAGSCFIIFFETALGEAVRIINGAQMYTGISVMSMLAGTVIMIICMSWQIPFVMVLNMKIGNMASLIINSFLNIFFIVFAATKDIWILFPHCYTSRLEIPAMGILPNGLMAVEGSQTFYPELLSSSVIIPGIIISLALFILFVLIGMKLYEKKEAL